MNFDKKVKNDWLFNLIVNPLGIVIALIIIVVFGMRYLGEVNINPNDLTVPVALKLTDVKSIDMMLVTDDQNKGKAVDYIPWLVTYKNNSTQTFPKCQQNLPKNLFAMTLKLDIGGHIIMLNGYPIRAAFTNSFYRQRLMDMLTCIANSSKKTEEN